MKEPSDVAPLLGRAAPFLTEILSELDGLPVDWTTGVKGRLLKVKEGKKALCYLALRPGELLLRMTVREGERESLLEDERFAHMAERLRSAARFPEGYLLELTVRDARGCAAATSLLAAVRTLRLPRGRRVEER